MIRLESEVCLHCGLIGVLKSLGAREAQLSSKLAIWKIEIGDRLPATVWCDCNIWFWPVECMSMFEFMLLRRSAWMQALKFGLWRTGWGQRDSSTGQLLCCSLGGRWECFLGWGFPLSTCLCLFLIPMLRIMSCTYGFLEEPSEARTVGRSAFCGSLVPVLRICSMEMYVGRICSYYGGWGCACLSIKGVICSRFLAIGRRRAAVAASGSEVLLQVPTSLRRLLGPLEPSKASCITRKAHLFSNKALRFC